MAPVSRKELEAVRRLVQKGSRQKALAAYARLIELSPEDPKLLLEVGDVHRRWDQVEEAVNTYTEVARLYQSEGFEMRAIAMLKKVVELDAERLGAHLVLADLYQKSGFKGEAVATLRVVSDLYSKKGREKEALESLRKMAAADVSLTANRIEAAEKLARAGKNDEAVSEYREAISVLLAREAPEEVAEIRKRILSINPDDAEAAIGIARDLFERGQTDQAEPYALRGLEAEPRPEYFELLCDIYTSRGDEERLARVLRNLANFHRERGDDSKAREVLQRLPQSAAADSAEEVAGEEATAEDLFGSLEDLDDSVADVEEVEDAGGKVDPQGLAGAESELPGDESPLELEREIGGSDSGPQTSQGPVSGEGSAGADEDLEEADFYFQQGLFEEAEPIYRRVLEKEPDHPVALQKIAEMRAGRGGAEPLPGGRGAEDPGRALEIDLDLDLGAGTNEGEGEGSIEIDLELGGGGGEDEESPNDQGGGFNVDFGAEEGIELELGSPGEVTEPSAEVAILGQQKLSDADEFERHFDLGVGYRDMKLFENAMEEFGRCVSDPEWRGRSLHMMGLCALDLGRHDDAIQNLEEALSHLEQDSAEWADLHFALGSARAALGEVEGARESFAIVRANDPSHAGLDEALAGLDAVGDEANLDSLEDLIAEITPEDLKEG